MFRKISHYFHHAAKKPINILVTVGAQLIFGLFILPKMQATIDPAQHTTLLDLRFGYTTTQVQLMLKSIGENGRKMYLINEILFDFLNPCIYSIAFCLLLSLFFQQSYSSQAILQNLNLFPIVVGIFDILENLGIVGLLLSYPKTEPNLVLFASWAGLFKWGATLLNLILLFMGIFSWAFHHLTSKPK
jgi:hypothetical protein